MKLYIWIVSSLILISSFKVYAETPQARADCTLGSPTRLDHNILGDRPPHDLILDEKDKTGSWFQTPQKTTMNINGRAYVLFVRYLGKIGNKGKDWDPTDLFRVSLLDVEKNVYASSLGQLNTHINAEFNYPDGSYVSTSCFIYKK